MAFDIFTKEELSVAFLITKVALYILVITAVVTTLIRMGLIYTFDGQTDIDATIGVLDKPILKDPKVANELPQYLEVPSLGIRTTVESPVTTSVTVLDNALSRGPVYYQGSGTPGNRNMLIFGHSTGFSIVHNQAYKVFNNIKLGKKGEYVYIRTSSGTYTYVIQEVKKVSKYSTWIQFNSDKPLLTLSTCDSFGKKSDRWVLEAEYMGYKKN